MKQVVDFHPVFDPCPSTFQNESSSSSSTSLSTKEKENKLFCIFYIDLHVVYQFNRLDIELGEMRKTLSLQLQRELLPQVHSEVQQISVLCSTSPAA